MIFNQYKWASFKLKQNKDKTQIYQTLNSIKQSKVKSISMENLHDPLIVHHFIHIKFQRLSYIWLGGNLIDNIEFLNFIDFPSLRHLGLNCNYITKIKTLVKISSRNFRLIDIQYNLLKIQDFQTTSRINFNKAGQILIKDQLLIQKKQLTFLQDNSNLFKLQTDVFSSSYTYQGLHKKLIDKNRQGISVKKQQGENQ